MTIMPDPTRSFEELLRSQLGQPISRRELLQRGLALGLSLPAIATALAACAAEPRPLQVSGWPGKLPTAGVATPSRVPSAAPAPGATSTPGSTPPPAPARFAVIGDFGLAGEPARAVSDRVKSWQPDFIITVGDNNYPAGSAATLDANVGQYYADYIAPYKGHYGPGGTVNRFFPSLGNHDWQAGDLGPYLGYFNLPGNGRYYSFAYGALRFFALDSMPGEPDGVRFDSKQAAWLRAEMAASTATWNIVYFHHPPYSSGHHGSNDWMRWPFRAWGADLVLAGHDHNYERLEVEGLTYVVNGLGGGARYAPGCCPQPGSQVFFNRDHGAMLIEADRAALHLRFATHDGDLVDEALLKT